MKKTLLFDPDLALPVRRRRSSFDLQSSPCKSKKKRSSATSVPLAERVVISSFSFAIRELQSYRVRPIRTHIYEMTY